jgi:putative CocE/NonD family hydrolase
MIGPSASPRTPSLADVDVIDPVWIPLADGCRLAARVWRPAGSVSAGGVPAIVEAIPYRRRDGTLVGDHGRYAWWAARGFAGVRLDLRGSGDSDGVLEDEYLESEQDDIAEALAWVARQPWCSGRVGMIGYSWGGFSGLQVAARRPPELGAVVTINSTARRYTDDCHYTGGSVNAHDMLSWATTMLAFDARPPDPAIVGPDWRARWRQRLDVAPPMIERWLAHQLEDAYWRHGSVSFDYGAITVPVLAVGGWSDPYRNAVIDLVDHLEGPRFALIGPWAHGYPHVTDPGPRIDFLGECARFFGRYLRGDENGYDAQPVVRSYVQGYDAPAPFQQHRTGRWVSLRTWPGERDSVLALHADGLRVGDATPFSRRIGSTQTTGLAAGSWCPYGGPSQPLDQRADDALSLVFDTPPLDEPLEILGFPELHLNVSADRPQALVAARVCDVDPTGVSLLVTRGVLNLAHRDGHDRVVPLEPGVPAEVALRLDAAGHRFERGHRLRLALSPTYWPWIWPSPRAATLAVSEGSHLRLPLLGAAEPWSPGEPEDTPVLEEEWITASPMSHVLVDEITTGRVELRSQPDFLAGRRRIEALDLEVEDHGENVYSIERNDPLSAEVRCVRSAALSRSGFDVRIEADARMRCSADEFIVETNLRAYDAGEEIASRRFETRVPRADA